MLGLEKIFHRKMTWNLIEFGLEHEVRNDPVEQLLKSTLGTQRKVDNSNCQVEIILKFQNSLNGFDSNSHICFN
jgi:hypothetical protein